MTEAGPALISSATYSPESFDESVRILLVDDDPGILETLEDIFQDMGYMTRTASTGRQALARLDEHLYHLALLDIRLPDMQGTELLAQIRSRQPHVLCIMATGNASLPSAVESLDQGAYAYLQKPIDVADVKARVRRALEQQRLEWENRRLLAHLQALGAITDAALATLELDELMALVLDKFTGYHHADSGVIYLLDPLSGQLVPRMAQGIAPGEPLELGKGAAGRAAESGDLIAVAGDEVRLLDGETNEVQATLAVPLRSRNRLIGVVRLDRWSARPFASEEQNLLRVLAERAAVLIDNARLYDEERLLRSEAEALWGLASQLVERIGLGERLSLISDYLLRVTGTTRSAIWLTTRDELRCTHLRGVAEEHQRRLMREGVPLEELPERLSQLLDTGRPAVLGGTEATPFAIAGMTSPDAEGTVLVLPLRIEGRPIGLVTLDEPGQRRGFTDRQIRQSTLIAFMSGGAIQQARTIQEERDVARTLAESFLSKSPDLDGVQVASCFVPASEVAQVGGDYFDFVELDAHRHGVIIGDVCGKGLAAAIYTAMAKYMLRAYALESRSPSWVISRLNKALYSQMSEECMFITMIYGVLDLQEGTFTYTNAAHPAPILYQPESDEILELAQTGGMVGAMEDVEFGENTVKLEPNSVLTMFTDGVTEARTGQRMMESEGVQQVVREQAGENAEAIANAIFQRAQEFGSGVLRDDVAIVVIKNG